MGGGIKWEYEINRCMFPYFLKEINDKDLLCSIGNYIHCLIISYNRTEWEKRI